MPSTRPSRQRLDFDAVVIGAGLIGMASAEELAHTGRSVVIVERNTRCAQETSSRNSGVCHAGLYYARDSLKTTLCIEGRRLLEQRSRDHGFALKKTGKLLVATGDDEARILAALLQNAEGTGVPLQVLDGAQLRRLEPALTGEHALLSPESGIVDVEALATSYRRGAVELGATLALGSRVTAVEPNREGWSVLILGRDGSLTEVRSRWVINAAGLDADQIARMAGVDVDALGLRQHLCKGSYFILAHRFTGALSRLVYPVPSGPGLGIHLTLDLNGALRAGPDAEYVTTRDLGVREDKRALFCAAIQRYFPQVHPGDLAPAYAGLRPKLAGPGEAPRDFLIRHEASLEQPGFVNLLGIESPGLTASPAIARLVRRIVSGTADAT